MSPMSKHVYIYSIKKCIVSRKLQLLHGEYNYYNNIMCAC